MKRIPLLAAGGLLVLSGSAFAATFAVNRTDDGWDGACDTHCTLRDAVQAANDTPGADVIQLQGTTYRLTLPPPADDSEEGVADEDENRNGDLDVADDVVIKGTPATYIDAGYISRIFEVLPAVTAEFRDLRLRRGQGLEVGGAVANFGNLRLVRVDVRLNRATSFLHGLGGGVYNEGYLSVADSHFQANRADGGADGGSGEGGAIYSRGRLNVRTTAFVDNHVSGENEDGYGGAIMNRVGLATIDRSYFTKNTTFSEGGGAAISSREGGHLRLTNSTVSGNRSGLNGGAVASGTRWETPGRLTMRFSTIANNEGGGLYNSGDAVIHYSIVGGNFERVGTSRDYHAGTNCVNDGTMSSLISITGIDGNCPFQVGILNDQVMKQLLHPLANNGGFGLTHALRSTSDHAIDRVPPFADCPSTDQRGAPRPVEGDNRDEAGCDIGAFEKQATDD